MRSLCTAMTKSSPKWQVKSFSRVWLFANPWAIVHGILQVRILEWVAFHSPVDLPNPGTEPRSPSLQVDSLPAKPQRKPKNTRVGSLSLLQGIFLTQELNWGLLHCRHILYQLSYERSPCLLQLQKACTKQRRPSATKNKNKLIKKNWPISPVSDSNSLFFFLKIFLMWTIF